MITNPLTVNPDVTLADLDKLCGRFHISGLPVVDKENRLVGIITNRDMRFIPSDDYDHLRVKDVMTRENLVTGPANISKEDGPPPARPAQGGEAAADRRERQAGPA